MAKENSELKLELANYQNSGEKINGVDIKEFALLLKSKKTENLVFKFLVRGDDIPIENLLSFFHYLSIENSEGSGSVIDIEGKNAFGNSLRYIRTYELVEKNSLYLTVFGTKLMVYLEINPYLLE